MSGGIAAVSSLALEARAAAGGGVFAVCSQGERLAAALESAVARVACASDIGIVGLVEFPLRLPASSSIQRSELFHTLLGRAAGSPAPHASAGRDAGQRP